MITTNRSCEIHFINNTSVVWYRHLHSTHHGCWLQPPRESIFPNQTMVCLAECTRSFGSFSGKIQYAVVLNDVEYIVSSEFEVPILGDNRHVSVMGCNSDPRKKKMPDPLKIFELAYTADTFVYSKFLVTVKETAEGSVFLQKCREELEQALAGFYQACPQGLADPLDIPPRIPMHFVWNVKNVDWKKRLRKSHRSMLIRIVNLTTHLLVLDRRREEKERLEEGIWLEFPSEQIPPLCLTEFGCQSDGFLFGTGGSCTYLIPGRPGQFVFFWDQPGMGGCRSLGVHTGKAFRVFKHTENLNEGTIVFHVIDPSHPPCVQIVQARSLHPQRLASFQSFRSGESRSGSTAPQPPSSAASRREFLRDSTDLTHSLVTYLRRSALEASGTLGNFPGVTPHFGRSGTASAVSGSSAAPSVGGCDEPLGSSRGASSAGLSSSVLAVPGTAGLAGTPQSLIGGLPGRGSSFEGDEGTTWCGSVEISLVSPRAFFCALQSTKILRGASQPNSLLYIQWRIGSEIFERVFGPDERVFLHGGLVGGLDRNQTDLILRAEPVNLRRLPPGLKVADLSTGDTAGIASLLALSSGAGAGATPAAAGSGALGVRPVTNEAELLEVLVRGFRICASGMLREVSERMEAAYGVDWLTKCDLPRQHIWKDLLGNGEGEQIDLEGLLHIMTAFWDEVFEERLEDPQPLHAMQAVVIYWATQELAVLDGPYVFSFFETAVKVLQKLGQSVHASKLQDLSRALDGTARSFASPEAPSMVSASVGERSVTASSRTLKEGTASTRTGTAVA